MARLDPREARLREIAQARRDVRELDIERDILLRQLAAERGKGALPALAKAAGLTRARVHQIVTDGTLDDPRSR